MEGTDGEVAGRNAVVVALRIKPKTSPLSTDAAQVTKWLEEQPNVLELRKHYTYEELKEMLSKWLNPEEAETTTSTNTSYSTKTTKETEADDEESDLPWEDGKTKPAEQKTFTTVVKKPSKKAPADKFDEIFSK